MWHRELITENGDHRCLRDRKSENDTNDQTTYDTLDQVDAVPFLNQVFHSHVPLSYCMRVL